MKWTNKGHQFDEIGMEIVKIKKILIFGAQRNGRFSLRANSR